MALPLLYYGLQGLLAPLYPGYSLLATTASDLGTLGSPTSALFNPGVVLIGVCGLLTAAGYARALPRVRVPVLWTTLCVLCIAAFGLNTLWAAVYPQPAPQHGQNPFTPAVLLLPVALLIALWKPLPARGFRALLVGSLLLFLAMVPVVSGALGLNTAGYGGLIQRLFTLTLLPSLGIGAWLLHHRLYGTGAAQPDPLPRSST